MWQEEEAAGMWQEEEQEIAGNRREVAQQSWAEWEL